MEHTLKSYPDNSAISMLVVILALSVSSSHKYFMIWRTGEQVQKDASGYLRWLD